MTSQAQSFGGLLYFESLESIVVSTFPLIRKIVDFEKKRKVTNLVLVKKEIRTLIVYIIKLTQ